MNAQMLEYFCHQRELPISGISESDLIEYLNFLLVNHDYLYKMLSTYCQTTPYRDFRKNLPARVWAETWDIKEVIDVLYS